jgi:hypothetical protein
MDTRLVFDINCFWSKVRKDHSCWIWMGAKYPKGYGAFRVRNPRRTISAHRVSYYLAHGVLPDLVMHTCDIRDCVNPEHLLSGTPAENTADMMRKGRNWTNPYPLRGDDNWSRKHPENLARGEDHPRAKITEQLAVELLRDRSKGESIGRLSVKYSLTKSTIHRICIGKIWAHLPRPIGVGSRLKTRRRSVIADVA